ncbi:hypothetical protein A2V56_03535 [Candidatus Woesebacteria bacterium RBG_19FT_COMBO_42_9]|uniref:Secondary thiamine-phosphate synthase enzyme n=1 Tax=Candidatus Woesebacteria bacterium RBG_16_42_24 TaxID=1802485 RepID=A0A1F7XKM5_9BACT|nr:MAG: hypothetical protein A2V97_00705 [Candidatus Woesebacteria bacterium RBG_16_42_24]OGM16125.1 MAG: hypothetical protein A2V56_03535 [Candidatus Woesebacteria bacterium RBG_19FT_COMBO_42_9]OGM67968.1 MAG: hypothetical protein A2985_02065 [Candidatus Woesebacteria bacterium RIFCSPLOWO2_01_FULL_43_11]
MEISVRTKGKKEIVDITENLNVLVSKENFKEGLCNLFILHTTCALTTMDLDPGTDIDFLEAIEKMFPKGSYRHPHDPSHVGEHIMASIIGPSVSVPVSTGKLILGTWQRVVLVELSGPRERNIQVNFVKWG